MKSSRGDDKKLRSKRKEKSMRTSIISGSLKPPSLCVLQMSRAQQVSTVLQFSFKFMSFSLYQFIIKSAGFQPLNQMIISALARVYALVIRCHQEEVLASFSSPFYEWVLVQNSSLKIEKLTRIFNCKVFEILS